MTKTLLKKQMMETFSWVYFNRKNGKKRTGTGLLAYIVLCLGVYGMLGCMFYEMADAMCNPLSKMGYGWLYFVMISLSAILMGVFGSVFSTFTSLYQAKDNDLLLSMPIPTSKIIMMRLSGVYMLGLIYELIVMIPALIVWFRYVDVSLPGIVFSIIIPFEMSIFVLTLSCILGWVVALISAKVKNKSFVTVFLSLAFIAGYYYIYMRAYKILGDLIANAQGIADGVKNILFPFYHMAMAAEGNAISMLIFTGIILALFGIVYIVLSRGFIRLATTNKGAAKVKYNEGMVKSAKPETALLKKELKRFTGSPNYIMNCGLGIILMIVAGVALIVKCDTIRRIISMPFDGIGQMVPLIVTAALCIVVSTNDISAPSVSLEGKNIWILQVFPVSAWQVLKAKMKLHLLLTVPPAAFMTACALVVTKPSVEFLILIPVTVAIFIVDMAMFGLFMNLKTPNLNWTNEVVPIKQSFSVLITLFGGWAIVIIFAIVYLIMDGAVSSVAYLSMICGFFALLAILLFFWLKNRGTKIFERL
ncbi:MAG: hypothetical protein ACI4D4_07760 [Lachnospira sp.]